MAGERDSKHPADSPRTVVEIEKKTMKIPPLGLPEGT
jgi:hypothetical protein